MIHQLKILKKNMSDIEVGNKRFEVRLDDRGYQVDDTLLMEEVDDIINLGLVPTGKQVYVLVTYIHRNSPGFSVLRDGYVVMGFDIIRWIYLCNCNESDAWRCAVDKNLRTVSCPCGCHRYNHAK